MRERYTHILPEIQRVLANNQECKNIVLSEKGCILEKKNGVKLYFDFTQAMCRAEIDLIMGEDPEKEGMDYVNTYLSGHGGRTVLDIGANVGLFSLDLYQNHRDIIYHVFEPIPATYQKLKETAKLNQVDDEKYLTHNIGFSDKIGTFEFYLPAESEAASFRPVEDEFYRKRSTVMGEYTGFSDMEKVMCKVETVDKFVQENGIRDIGFIKIDVEGNEKSVLHGAEDTLRREKPLVYCELLHKHEKRFGYHPNDVITFMGTIGYKYYTMQKGKLAEVDRIDEDILETNFFFIEKSL